MRVRSWFKKKISRHSWQ